MHTLHVDAEPKVTVVIPTQNRNELLRRSVRSALRQTHPNLEIIVVVDGYSSGTIELLTTFQKSDARLRWIVNDEPVGGAEARNMGARAGDGAFIAFLDDDDEWLPVKLETQVESAIKVHGDVIVSSRYIYRNSTMRDEIWPLHLPEKGKLSECLFDTCGGLQTSTLLCNRRLFLERPFTSGLKGHQDFDWILRASSIAGVQLIVIPEPLSIYHIGNGGGKTGSSFNWRMSLAWGAANRSLMTPLGYSRFIAYHAARLAVLQNDRLSSFGPLLGQLFSGELRARVLIDFFAKYLLSVSMRARIRRVSNRFSAGIRIGQRRECV